MKTYVLSLTFLFIALAGFSQKIKIKDDVATVDGEAYLNWEKRNAANEASISGMNAEGEEIYITFLNYTDPNKVTDSNPEGKVRWIEINFLDLDIKCEISSRTHKGVVKLLYQSNVYVDGVLNEENARKFVKKYGTRFSDNRPNGNVNIIINN